MKITQVYAREIIDSRASPTVEAVVFFENGEYGIASSPSGTSTGSNEVAELRDDDQNRFQGLGVLKAVNHVNQDIAKALIGQAFDSPIQLDATLVALDATPNKTNLGANAILAVSTAATKAFASSAKLPLYRYIASLSGNTNPLAIPTPVFNMINGGQHGAGNLDFQEFHVLPKRVRSYADQYETGVVIYNTIKKLLSRRGAIHSVGDEGGFAPNLFTNLDALEILKEAILEVNKKPIQDVEMGLDVAANTFYKDGKYSIKDRSTPMDTSEFIEYLRDLNTQYRLTLLEDALADESWHDWSSLTAELGSQLTVVGDDLLATNKGRVQRAITEKCCNGAIIKPNQIGTVSEAIGIINQAREAGWKIIVSHRSGETNDTFIADFAVGVGAHYAKFGAPARGERVAKYNRFLGIESELSQTL